MQKQISFKNITVIVNDLLNVKRKLISDYNWNLILVFFSFIKNSFDSFYSIKFITRNYVHKIL